MKGCVRAPVAWSFSQSYHLQSGFKTRGGVVLVQGRVTWAQGHEIAKQQPPSHAFQRVVRILDKAFSSLADKQSCQAVEKPIVKVRSDKHQARDWQAAEGQRCPWSLAISPAAFPLSAGFPY
jgi:hypothetical protein